MNFHCDWDSLFNEKSKSTNLDDFEKENSGTKARDNPFKYVNYYLKIKIESP